MATVSRNGTGQNSENRQQAAIVPTIVDNGINKIWNLYFLMGADSAVKFTAESYSHQEHHDVQDIEAEGVVAFGDYAPVGTEYSRRKT